MFFLIYPIIYTIVYALTLETAAYKENFYFGVLSFLVLFSFIAIWPLTRKKRFVAIPFFFSLGSFNLLYLIDSSPEKQLFIIFSSIIYYISLLGAYRLRLYKGDRTAQGMINFATLAAVFFWYTSNYGWYLNFQIDSWVLVITFIGSTFLISYPSLKICLASRLEKNEDQNGINYQSLLLLDLIFSFLMAEIIWALSYWPFSYLTTGAVSFILFFIFWDIIRNFILGHLSKKMIVVNIILSALSIAGILATARWELVV